MPSIPELNRPVRMIVAGDSTGEAYGNGVVSWAAASPGVAQAELSVERGCGFVRDGDYRLDGEWVRWFPMGRIRSIKNWKEGKAEGLAVQFNAQKLKTHLSSWKDGRNHGPARA